MIFFKKYLDFKSIFSDEKELNEFIKQMNTVKIDRIRKVMYTMFKEEVLPSLDMEDFEVMWEALLLRRQIHIDYNLWQEFIEAINCKTTDDENKFNYIFDSYFKTEADE